MMVFIFIVFTPVLAALIRLAELPYIDIADAVNEGRRKVDQFDSYVNAYYIALCTIATLGFGDYYTSTTAGRIFATFGFILGNILLALFIYGVSSMIAFDEEEKRAYQMIQKKAETATLNDRAADVLTTALRLNKLKKKRDGTSMGQRFI